MEAPDAAYWSLVNDASRQTILGDLSLYCEMLPYPVDCNRAQLRRFDLPFYQLVSLYELVLATSQAIEPIHNTESATERTYFLWGPGLLLPLGGDPAKVITWNKRLTALGAFVLNEDNASNYLQFRLSFHANWEEEMQLRSGLRVTESLNDDGQGTMEFVPLQFAKTPDYFHAQVIGQDKQGFWRGDFQLFFDGRLPTTDRGIQGISLTGDTENDKAHMLPPLHVYRPGKRLVLEELPFLKRLATSEPLKQGQQIQPGPWQVAEPLVRDQLVSLLNQQHELRLPGEDCRVQVLVLPFYHQFDLYEVSELANSGASATALPRRFMVLWAKYEVALTGRVPSYSDLLRPLDLTTSPIYELNAELWRTEELDLTLENVLAYVRFYMGLVRRSGNFLNLVNGFSLQIQPSSDEPNAQITVHLPELEAYVAPNDTYWLPACIEYTGGLYEVDIVVQATGVINFYNFRERAERPTGVKLNCPYDTFAAAPLPNEPQTRPPVKTFAEYIAPLAAKAVEPDNQVIEFDNWEVVTLAVHHLLIKSLNEVYTPALPPKKCRVRVHALPFYHLFDLYEIRISLPKGAVTTASESVRCYYVLWVKPELLQLPGSIEPVELPALIRPLSLSNASIYELNEELRKVGGLHLTLDTIPAYVRFFFQLVCGRHGFFNLVNDLVLHLRDSDAADDADSVIRRLPAVQAELLPGGVHRVQTYMGFQKSLFLADVLVQPDGHVQMTNEVVVGDILTSLPWLNNYQTLEYKSNSDSDGLRAHRYQFILQFILQKRRLAAIAAKETWDAQEPSQRLSDNGTGLDWHFLSADAFVALAQKREGLPIENCYVMEPVRFTNQNMPHGRLELDNCFFAAGVQCDLTLENTEFKAVRSFFQNGLYFGHGWQGFVYLQGCWAFAIPDIPEKRDILPEVVSSPLLTLEGLSTTADIKCDMLWLRGELHLSSTACKMLQLTNCRVDDTVKAERLTSREAQLSGHFSGINLTQARVEGSVSLTLVGSRKRQSTWNNLTAFMLRCEAFSLRGVGGRARLDSLQLFCAHAARIELSNFTIIREIDLYEAVIEGSLNIFDADITGYANLNDLRAARITLYKMRLRKGSADDLVGNLILDRVVAEFDLSIRSVYIDGHLSAKALTVGHRLILGDLRVGQDVKLSRSRIERGIRIGSWFADVAGHEQGVAIAGNLRLDQVQAGPVHISPCRIGGQLYARQAHFESFRYLPGLVQHQAPGKLVTHQLMPSLVAGTVWLSGTTIAGNFDWVGVDVEGANENSTDSNTRCGLVADMLHVQGNLRFHLEDEDLFRTVIETYREYSSVLDEPGQHKYAQAKKTRILFEFSQRQPITSAITPAHCRTHISHSLELEGLRLGGNLDLSWLWVDGRTNLNASQINGKLLLQRSHIGQLQLLRGVVQHDLLILHAHIGSATQLAADLAALTVHGQVKLVQSHFNCTLDLNGATLGSLSMDGVTIGGTLVMSSGTVQHDCDIASLYVRATCINERYPAHKVDLTALSVNGQLRLRLTVLNCSLDLTDASLLRGLKATGVKLAEPALYIQGNLVLNSATSKEDIDLTGVQLEASSSAQWPSHSLEAVNLSVEGELKLANAFGMTLLQIPGDINLSRAKIHQLTLSDKTHQTGRQKKQLRTGPDSTKSQEQETDIIRLDYAHIDLLRTFLPPPSPLSLNGLTVTQWSFGNEDSAEDKAQQYIDFLGQEDDVVQKPLYRAIEKQLYEQGDEQASDKVYTAMWKRDNKSPFLKGLYSFFGYFTDVPTFTILILVSWVAFSTFIFWQPTHVVATDALLSAARGRMADAAAWRPFKSRLKVADAAQYAQDSVLLRTRHPQDWGSKGIWLMLRYHLPMIPITAEADWAPSPQPSKMLFSGSPTSYAGVVSVLSWLIVPTLAIIWTRRILKRARQT